MNLLGFFVIGIGFITRPFFKVFDYVNKIDRDQYQLIFKRKEKLEDHDDETMD